MSEFFLERKDVLNLDEAQVSTLERLQLNATVRKLVDLLVEASIRFGEGYLDAYKDLWRKKSYRHVKMSGPYKVDMEQLDIRILEVIDTLPEELRYIIMVTNLEVLKTGNIWLDEETKVFGAPTIKPNRVLMLDATNGMCTYSRNWVHWESDINQAKEFKPKNKKLGKRLRSNTKKFNWEKLKAQVGAFWRKVDIDTKDNSEYKSFLEFLQNELIPNIRLTLGEQVSERTARFTTHLKEKEDQITETEQVYDNETEFIEPIMANRYNRPVQDDLDAITEFFRVIDRISELTDELTQLLSDLYPKVSKLVELEQESLERRRHDRQIGYVYDEQSNSMDAKVAAAHRLSEDDIREMEQLVESVQFERDKVREKITEIRIQADGLNVLELLK